MVTRKIGARIAPAPRRRTPDDRRSTGSPLTVLPAGLACLLLVLATVWDGAFDVREWGPLALFVLVVLGVLAAASRGLAVHRTLLVPLVALWAFTLWTGLSAIWAHSPDGAWQGAARTSLYAGLVTLIWVLRPGPSQVRMVGNGLIGAIAALGLATLVRMHLDASALFVAGRLDAPIGYRNATGALFALIFWPLVCGASGRGRSATLRGAAAALAALALGLAFLTQSRGVVFALVAGAVVALGLGPDRVRRVWFSVLALGAITAGSPWLLRPYDSFVDQGLVSPADLTTAAWALTMLVAIVFAVACSIALFDQGLRGELRGARRVWRLANAGLLTLVAIGGCIGLVRVGNPVAFAEEKVTEFRRLEDTSDARTRLTETGGQRYDIWRVALEQFLDEPVHGVGEGSFRFGYYTDRESDRNVSQAHSLPLGVLAELGLVGMALFAVFWVSLIRAILAARSYLGLDLRGPGVGLLAAAASVFAGSLVDWFWVLPGVVGIGFLCLALGTWSLIEEGSIATTVFRLPRAARVGFVTLALVAAGGVLALSVSDLYLRKARAASHVAERLDAARTAARWAPLSVVPRYLEASAEESLGRRSVARTELREALDLEPRNFVTLALLGDLEVRAGSRARAHAYYLRAERLNPRDVGLRELVRRTAPSRQGRRAPGG
jgi:O-Antigen ligase